MQRPLNTDLDQAGPAGPVHEIYKYTQTKGFETEAGTERLSTVHGKGQLGERSSAWSVMNLIARGLVFVAKTP